MVKKKIEKSRIDKVIKSINDTGYTARFIAKKVKVSEVTISNYRNGEKKYQTLSMTERLEKFFEEKNI